MMPNPFKRAAAKGLPLLLALGGGPLTGCTETPTPGVEEYWGVSYAETMKAQIANPHPKPPSEDEEADKAMDSVTADLILENYENDVLRPEQQERDTFIIDTGVQ